jgi:Sec-independent protein translocase protein TatA
MKKVFFILFISSSLMVFSGQEKPELATSSKKTIKTEKKNINSNESNTPQLSISNRKKDNQTNPNNNAEPKPALMEKKSND